MYNVHITNIILIIKVFHLLENCPDGHVIIDGLCCHKGEIVVDNYQLDYYYGPECVCEGEYVAEECVPCADGWTQVDGFCRNCPPGIVNGI